MPLVSIIIPTHNRACYAIPTIRSVLAASPEIEIVVCDTSEVDLISVEFSNSSDLSRLRLVRPNRAMSVVENFNEALQVATGEYLVYIGDDDFVSPTVVDVANWAARHNVDAVKFSFPVHYFWPDFKHSTRNGQDAGTLHIAHFTGTIVPHDAKKALLEAIHNLGGGVLEMPRVYAGMISRKLAEKICTQYGALFGGVSPDIYSAALISLESERCVKIDFPVIVPGASGASTAGQSANGKHVGGLRDNSHIGAFMNLQWDDKIPEFYSVPTVWSYSLLKAIEAAHIDIDKVNFLRLYTKCLIYQRPFVSFTFIPLLAYARRHGWILTAVGLLTSCAAEMVWVAGKLRDRFKVRYMPVEDGVKTGLTDTLKASVALETYLAQAVIRLKLD
jgi:glycosyltransferase involved in cell wall biosynthesis